MHTENASSYFTCLDRENQILTHTYTHCSFYIAWLSKVNLPCRAGIHELRVIPFPLAFSRRGGNTHIPHPLTCTFESLRSYRSRGFNTRISSALRSIMEGIWETLLSRDGIMFKISGSYHWLFFKGCPAHCPPPP